MMLLMEGLVLVVVSVLFVAIGGGLGGVAPEPDQIRQFCLFKSALLDLVCVGGI